MTGLDVPKPPRIATLATNPAGYPIPWFVADGTPDPDFRVIAPERVVRAIRETRCWVCGQQLGAWKAFVIGPMCAVNRITAEPPSHLSCAEYSVQACPFLANPAKRRRTGGLPEEREVPGTMIERNPGVSLIWPTRSFRPFWTAPDPEHGIGRGILIHLGDPGGVQWWRAGRRATRAEVLESIESGVPILRAADEGNPTAQVMLDRQVTAAMDLVRATTPDPVPA